MQLLGDHGLGWVGKQPGRRKVEQRRYDRVLSRAREHVAEPDIDLHLQPGGAQPCVDKDASCSTRLRAADVVAANRGRVKDHAVVGYGQCAHLREHRAQPLGRDVVGSKKVDVASRPMRLILPDGKQCRALQSERLGVRRLREAIEKPLGRVAEQDQVEVFAGAQPALFEPLEHRRCHVPHMAWRHSRDSR